MRRTPTSCVASIRKAAPCFLSAAPMRAMSSAPPSDQCTDETDASASGRAPLRSIASSTAEVQSPSVHWSDGGALDIARIGAALKKQGAAFLIDATHDVGVRRIDVK